MIDKKDDEKTFESPPVEKPKPPSMATILVISWANDGESLRYRVLVKDSWSKEVYRIHKDEFLKYNPQIRIGGREKLPSDFKHQK